MPLENNAKPAPSTVDCYRSLAKTQRYVTALPESRLSHTKNTTYLNLPPSFVYNKNRLSGKADHVWSNSDNHRGIQREILHHNLLDPSHIS